MVAWVAVFFFFTSARVVVFLQVVTMTTGAVVPSDEVVAELCAFSLGVIPAFVKVWGGQSKERSMSCWYLGSLGLHQALEEVRRVLGFT